MMNRHTRAISGRQGGCGNRGSGSKSPPTIGIDTPARTAPAPGRPGRRRKPMLKEFREFALKGNAVNLAIGVIIGAAFGTVVSSVVNDILMPPIGKILGGVDFSNFFLVLGGGQYLSLKAAKDAGAATINYGVFVNKVLNPLIVARVVFLVGGGVKALRRAGGPAPPPK